ncbi:MAG: hypothetical protein M3548_19905 [Actinomycetota bacterium]|nr:hypothetical protein [Actinomycetota bacterium]
MIGASTGIDTPIGQELGDVELSELVSQLDTPRALYDVEVSGGHVWHLMLANRADDRPLDDEQWAQIVHDAMGRMGFEAEGRAPAPWVAIHHGASKGENDHVHVAVSLVREDGTRASIWRDRVKMSSLFRDTEQRYQLVQVDGRHGGGTLPAVDRADIEIAERLERPEPVRHTIARRASGGGCESRRGRVRAAPSWRRL